MNNQTYVVGTMTMKDMLGTEIKVGDQLVWAHSYGRSSARLARGVVVGFTKQRIKFVKVDTLKNGYSGRGYDKAKNISPGPSVLIVNEQPWDEVGIAKNEGLIPL